MVVWSAIGELAIQLIWVSLVFGFVATALNEAKSYSYKPTWREVRTSVLVTLILWIPNAIMTYVAFVVVFGALFGVLWLLSLMF